MAPLDTGAATFMLRVVDGGPRSTGPAAQDYDTLGAYLKAVREHRGQSLAELAEKTRVRSSYLSAIENGDRSLLPSRPFALGYVRSYAQALGLDGEAAVARFRDDWPEHAEPLRNPVGVAHEGRESRPLIYAGVAVLITAVGLWNVAQRTLNNDAPAAPSLPAALAAPPAPPAEGAPMKVGLATPAPAESSAPPLYVTPGLDPAAAAPGVAPATPAPAPVAPQKAAPAGFEPKGEVYGAPAGLNRLILQAKKRVSLIIRGPDKTVYFARELTPGQAYRAPLGRGLTADMSDPTAFDVYVGGQLSTAPLAEPALLDKVIVPAAPGASASAAPPAAR